MSIRPKISAISKVELVGGIYANSEFADVRRRAIEAMLRRLSVVDFDSAMATAYGTIVAQTGFNRRKIIDRMIAATAMVADLTLITNNGDDFSDIDGLKLEVWKI